MPNRNYRLGRSREYLIMKHLRKMGAVEATRSYASKGTIDVRGVFPDKVLLIQSKAAYIPKKELEMLVDFARSITASNIHVMLWRFKKGAWLITNFSRPLQEDLTLHQFERVYAL